MVLPTGTDGGEYKSMLLFTNTAAAESRLSPNDTLKTMLDVEFGSWIDLGYGVPALAL